MAELRIQGVIFDIDGTLADSLEHYYAFACDLVEHAGAPPVSRERVFALMGSGDPDLLRKLFPPDSADFESTLARIPREIIGAWMRRMAEETEPHPGCVDLLHRLHSAGYRLGIATSSGRALPFLDRWGVRHVFHSIVGREDVERRKPHPEPVLRCIEGLGVPSGAAVYVGDSPIDIEAGRAAGARTVAVLTGTSSREVLAAVEPDYILESAADLLDVL
jgi:HAD superfamily hydrolase (TIGR01549 family)